MAANLVFPARPVGLASCHQLRGLDDGAFVLQPQWQARRAVLRSDGRLYYRTGRPVRQRPWRDLKLPHVGLDLDLALLRDRAEVLDVMVARPFDQRRRMAERFGLQLRWHPVQDLDEVNSLLAMWLGSGQCTGVVLKRRDVPYPWFPFSDSYEPGWLQVTEPVERRMGAWRKD